jgi:hypothetical protein
MAAHLLRKFAKQAPVWLVRLLGNLWLPYLGAGIKITHVSSDYRHIKVCLKRTWYNKNYVGTQFGGSIYAMTDPFYMLQLINNLGSDYIVWDKAAHIEFKKPGKTNLYAEFKIDQKLIEEVKLKTKNQEKYIFELPVEVKDLEGSLIAHVNKTLYVRKKNPSIRN